MKRYTQYEPYDTLSVNPHNLTSYCLWRGRPPPWRDSGSACTPRCLAAAQVELQNHIQTYFRLRESPRIHKVLHYGILENFIGSPRNCPMNPERDQGVSGHPRGVELVGAIVCIDPAQNHPEMMSFILRNMYSNLRAWDLSRARAPRLAVPQYHNQKVIHAT